ncbi:CsbD-like protein [Streptococcus varani]|uniref:CsbD-like protein n=1 Tax=Streptococcus varani TaxID=1608583 RepID=A0A0E4H5Q1_9STRE|nr:CsbD family protein [Streptococcus varani]CQR25936.1 CsbD-like protein [Streptococcus varani]
MSDKLDTKVDQLKGSVKEGFGKLTGDKEIETEGMTEKLAAKAKEVVQDVKDSVEELVDGVKHSFDKDE